MSDTKLTIEERLAAAEQTLQTQQSNIAVLQEENIALKKQATVQTDLDNIKREKATIPDKTFKVDGKRYKFVLPSFRIDKENVLTAKDALTDLPLLEKLVRMNSGAIAEVN